MDPVHLEVRALRGHYRVPGAVATMGIVRSYLIAPPSVVLGFIESFCGVERDTFRDGSTKIAYGWAEDGRPKGYGRIMRKDHVWASGGVKPKSGGSPETQRPVLLEVWYDLIYRVSVDGPAALQVRQALRGETSRYGVLSLGESDNLVTWLQEGAGGAEWIVPGNQFQLPIAVPHRYDRLQPKMGGFSFLESQVAPEEAWMALPTWKAA